MGLLTSKQPTIWGLALCIVVRGCASQMAELSPSDIQYELEHINDNRPLDVIAFVAVALRFVARRASKAPLLANDWCIVVSLVSYLLEFLKRRTSRVHCLFCSFR